MSSYPCVVAYDELERWVVSTVDLLPALDFPRRLLEGAGVDASFYLGHAEELVAMQGRYESATWPREDMDSIRVMRRYRTFEDAWDGHQEIVERLGGR